MYQDVALCDNLDIVQNMFLGRERAKTVLLDEDSMETSAAALPAVGDHCALHPTANAAAAGRATRQAVGCARAVLWNSKLVIMDRARCRSA